MHCGSPASSGRSSPGSGRLRDQAAGHARGLGRTKSVGLLPHPALQGLLTEVGRRGRRISIRSSPAAVRRRRLFQPRALASPRFQGGEAALECSVAGERGAEDPSAPAGSPSARVQMRRLAHLLRVLRQPLLPQPNATHHRSAIKVVSVAIATSCPHLRSRWTSPRWPRQDGLAGRNMTTLASVPAPPSRPCCSACAGGPAPGARWRRRAPLLLARSPPWPPESLRGPWHRPPRAGRGHAHHQVGTQPLVAPPASSVRRIAVLDHARQPHHRRQPVSPQRPRTGGTKRASPLRSPTTAHRVPPPATHLLDQLAVACPRSFSSASILLSTFSSDSRTGPPGPRSARCGALQRGVGVGALDRSFSAARASNLRVAARASAPSARKVLTRRELGADQQPRCSRARDRSSATWVSAIAARALGGSAGVCRRPRRRRAEERADEGSQSEPPAPGRSQATRSPARRTRARPSRSRTLRPARLSKIYEVAHKKLSGCPGPQPAAHGTPSTSRPGPSTAGVSARTSSAEAQGYGSGRLRVFPPCSAASSCCRRGAAVPPRRARAGRRTPAPRSP